MTRPYSNEVRIAALEALIGKHSTALTKAERRELARLDAEMAAVDIDAMTEQQLDEYMAAHASDPGGKYRRHDELRRRARTPAQVAADEEFSDMLARMTPAEVDDYLAMAGYLSPPFSKETPP